MHYGTMMSEDKTLELLEVEVADAVSQCGVDAEDYSRAVNRIKYRFDQCRPVKPKFHKGQYGKKYDSYTCGNCGHTVEVINNYCSNCGYGVKWDNPRCLTGVKNE